MIGIASARDRIPFRAVNRRGTSDYDPGVQRHHLLPRQLLRQRCLSSLFEAVGAGGTALDDFRSNGLLLPCHDAAAMRMGLPLHRGPHRHYNAVVMERMGRIEAGWATQRLRFPDSAKADAGMRIQLLQRALRRRLLTPARTRLSLNRRDPLGHGIDFTELDAMAEALWRGTHVD